jgi:hypothetical protein
MSKLIVAFVILRMCVKTGPRKETKKEGVKEGKEDGRSIENR